MLKLRHPSSLNHPQRSSRDVRTFSLFVRCMLFLLIVSTFLGQWTSLITPVAQAAARPPSPAATTTLKQFTRMQHVDTPSHATFVRPSSAPPVPLAQADRNLPHQVLPSSAPATMKPLNQVLPANLFTLSPQTINTASKIANPLTLHSSDQRIDLQIPQTSVDLSRTAFATSTKASTSPSPTLNLSQLHGYTTGPLNQIGMYQMHLLDSKGAEVSGAHLLAPLKFVYHYQPADLLSLDLNPDQMVLSWPQALAQARAQHTSTSGLVVPLTNDANAHTLSANITQLVNSPFVASGSPQTQSPPTPHFAQVGDNSGQLTYDYPLQVPSGPGGFAPKLSLNYSTSRINERHNPTTPADQVGDGWRLDLGAITAEEYPASSTAQGTWYFLKGVASISDRLVPDTTRTPGNFYQTEHISRMRIQRVSGAAGDCFHIWDTSGMYYELGCTADSLQYRTDSSGTHYYRWDLDKIIAPNEGPGSVYKLMLLTYNQDKVTSGTFTSIRDSALKQIVYGTGTTTAVTNIAGTVDFSYHGAYASSADRVTQYTQNYNCDSTPADNTTLRCDNPLATADVPAPTIMSTFTLDSMLAYKGADNANNNKAYGFLFAYKDTPFSKNCIDPYTQLARDCAGEHILSEMTPAVYQSGAQHTLKSVEFHYTTRKDTYYDSSQTTSDGTQQFQTSTKWEYLTSYQDTNTNVGSTIAYKTAYSNTHGTPNDSDGNDRFNPFYCIGAEDNGNTNDRCSGNYAHPDDHTWSAQVVTQITALGTDSSDSTLKPGAQIYDYRLAANGTYSSNYSGQGTFCYPAGSNDQCVYDTYVPGYTGNGTVNGKPDADWQDYYHGEFRGFNVVYTHSPANDLTVDSYFSTEAWGTPESDSGNYNAGHKYQEDIYQGSNADDAALLQRTQNQYTGNSQFESNNGKDYTNSCTGALNRTYNPCEVFIVSTKTIMYEGTGTSNTNAPWVKHTYTYDDYDITNGLTFTGSVYHNPTKEVITSSNAPTRTKQWTYQPNDHSDSTWTYYTVDKAIHSEVTDDQGHKWDCRDMSYDGGASTSNMPAAGLQTGTQTYGDCSSASSQSSSKIQNYTGYDTSGNPVASVDGTASSNSSSYGSQGCTLATAPAYFTSKSNWSNSHYTNCASYDGASAQPTGTMDASGQTNATTYDDTQGSVATGETNNNNQTTSTSYSYDDSTHSRTLVSKQPQAAGDYSTKSSMDSDCSTTTTLPCFSIQDHTYLYANAITRRFYDSQSRLVETRTPGPASGKDTITFTVYNDQNHTTFESVPFLVNSDSTWLDPANATDYQGVVPGGTITFMDAMNRPTGLRDPLYGSSQEPGVSCPGLQGTWTSCQSYGLGTAANDSSNTLYHTVTSLDPNNHASVSFTDAFERGRYTQEYSGTGADGLANRVVMQKQMKYNGLDKMNSITTTDLSPQSDQNVTSVTTTLSYDDLGRVNKIVDPDRGTHAFTYDGKGNVTSDVTTSGSQTRTMGYVYDIQGRMICTQDTKPAANALGSCTSGSHVYVQNTYDQTFLGTANTSDFPKGQLTQSVANTYYADGSIGTVTKQYQHDQRGRVTKEHIQISVPAGWNVTSAPPAYEITMSYNDANQLTTTTTSTVPAGLGGYTTTQVYDSNNGTLIGLSNNSNKTANLATLDFNARGLVDTVHYQTDAGTALTDESFSYDPTLLPTGASATWQGGSGNSGNIFSQQQSYDAAGSITSLSTTHAQVPGASNSGGSEAQNFCYDEQSRLLWAGNNGSQPDAGAGVCGNTGLSNSLAGANYNNTFAYTHLDQLWQGPLDGQDTKYQYLYCDSAHPHQLTGLYQLGTTCASKSSSNQIYTSQYDAWGNVTSRSVFGTTAQLSYDGQDRMTEWNAGPTNHEWYLYDSSGTRILRRSINATDTTLTTYPFGNQDFTYSGAGVKQHANYYYTLAGRLIGKVDGGQTTFFLTDTLGSLLSSLNAKAGSASIQGNQVYGPYGEQRYHSGTLGSAKGFTGQYNDSLTGLDYYNARYYDHLVGRFLSADSTQGNMQGEDPYMYVQDNPETYNDPSGHCPMCIGALVGAAVGAVANVAITAGTDWLQHKTPTGQELLQAGIVGGVTGGVVGALGPEAAPLARVAAGAVGSGAGQATSNLVMHKPVMNGVGSAMVAGAVTGGIAEGAGALVGRVLRPAASNVLGDGQSVLSKGASALGNSCSFTNQTTVAIQHGNQAIGTVQAGEKVWAYNPKTKKMELQPILHVWIHKDDDLVDLTITTSVHSRDNKATNQTTEVIHTNKKHPFLTTEKGFLPVGQITIGMHVTQANGHLGVITGWKLVPGVITMYNLEVAQDHTFVVGAGMWVVHNCDSTALATNMRNAGVDLQPGQQAHHLIPCQCENHPLVQASGINLDTAENGVGLYSNPYTALANGDVAHVGFHPSYNQAIRGILDRRYNSLVASGSLAQNTALDAVQNTMRDARYMLRGLGIDVQSGNISRLS